MAPMHLWSHPGVVLQVFFSVARQQVLKVLHKAKRNAFSLSIIVGLLVWYNPPAELVPHQAAISVWTRDVIFWVTMGVLSSVGLGSGLHTFLLFLGPHIIRVSLAAFLCDSVGFSAAIESYWHVVHWGGLPVPWPRVEYADNAFECPGGDSGDIGIWDVMQKVQFQCFLWGLGTAIGELPPYYIARRARLAGQMVEELEEVQALEDREGAVPLLERAKIFVYEGVKRYGFLVVAVFASVPNPLFDLAGMMCGHLLVPFSTFFGAVFVGKAIVKVSIQSAFYIAVFNTATVEWARSLLPTGGTAAGLLDKAMQSVASGSYKSCWTVATDGTPPMVAKCLSCCTTLMRGHNATGVDSCRDGCASAKELLDSGGGWGGIIWNSVIACVLLVFVSSIVESVANTHLAEAEEHKRGEEHVRAAGHPMERLVDIERVLVDAITGDAPVLRRRSRPSGRSPSPARVATQGRGRGATDGPRRGRGEARGASPMRTTRGGREY